MKESKNLCVRGLAAIADPKYHYYERVRTLGIFHDANIDFHALLIKAQSFARKLNRTGKEVWIEDTEHPAFDEEHS